MRILLYTVILLLAAQSVFSQEPREMLLADVDSLCVHYWDNYDFEDIAPLQTPDMVLEYIFYLQHLPIGDAKKYIIQTLEQSVRNKEIYRQFVFLFERYLYDKDSYFENEDLYETVLKHVISLPDTDSLRRIIPEYQFEMIALNRTGNKANDIEITLFDESKVRLYDIDGEYILLMFANPECPVCKRTAAKVYDSETIKYASDSGRLRTVCVFLDDVATSYNMDAYPENWIKGYDAEGRIMDECLYEIRQMPALYLLDQDKTVIVKEKALEYIEFVLHDIISVGRKTERKEQA